MQARLEKQVKDFLHTATTFLPTLEEVDLKPFEEEVIDTPAEEAVEPEDLVDGFLDEDFSYEEEDEAEVPSLTEWPHLFLFKRVAAPLSMRSSILFERAATPILI